MAYDEVLADRVRAVLEGESGLTEQRMFGGLGFMLDRHMAAAAGSKRQLMLRADPDADVDPLLSPMEMRGRAMSGWLVTEPDADIADEDLERLVRGAADYVRTLPPKAVRT